MSQETNKDKIIIIDFGSQVTKLIARRIREEQVFCEIVKIDELKKKDFLKNVKGIILSGGPATVTKSKFPQIPSHIFNSKIPILGICYGLQLIAKHFKGKIKLEKNKREFGKMEITKNSNSLLTNNFLCFLHFEYGIEISYLSICPSLNIFFGLNLLIQPLSNLYPPSDQLLPKCPFIVI